MSDNVMLTEVVPTALGGFLTIKLVDVMFDDQKKASRKKKRKIL